MAWKIGVFFAYMFGFVIALPGLVLFLVQRQIGPLQWPPPPAYMVDAGWYMDKHDNFTNPRRLLGADRDVVRLTGLLSWAEDAVAAVNTDGTLAAAARFAEARGTEAGIATLLQQYGITRREPGPQGDRLTGAMSGVLRHDANRLQVVLGMDAAAVERRLAAVAPFAMVANPAARKLPSKGQLVACFVGVLGWALLQFFIFGRVASWVGMTEPAPDTPPVAAAVLEERLMALNRLDVPFTIRRGDRPNELIADWRYADAKWVDLMRVNGITRVHRLTLRLDEGPHNVRAMDSAAATDWSAGRGGADLRFKAEVGITFFAYERGGVLGLQIKDGRLTLDPVYAWRFNLQDLKGPVVEVITASGWSYKPVITFFRPIGG